MIGPTIGSAEFARTAVADEPTGAPSKAVPVALPGKQAHTIESGEDLDGRENFNKAPCGVAANATTESG